jgi:hypothetical protein
MFLNSTSVIGALEADVFARLGSAAASASGIILKGAVVPDDMKNYVHFIQDRHLSRYNTVCQYVWISYGNSSLLFL